MQFTSARVNIKEESNLIINHKKRVKNLPEKSHFKLYSTMRLFKVVFKHFVADNAKKMALQEPSNLNSAHF